MSLTQNVVLLFSVILIVFGDPVPTRLNSSDLDIYPSNSNNNDNNNKASNQGGSDVRKRPLYTCVCDDLECYGTTCQTEGPCYVHIKDGQRTRSCTFTEQSGSLMCHSNVRAGQFTCCTGDFCNRNLTPAPPPQQPAVAAEEASDTTQTSVIIVLTAFVSLSVVVVVGLVLYRRQVANKRGGSAIMEGRPLVDDGSGGKSFNSKNMRIKAVDQTSGSGSGQVKLVTRTVGKEVHLIEKIGKGRFGDVWHGKWLGDNVAIKIFTSLEECSWRQEMEIYNTGMLSHENILVFHASDTIDLFSCTRNLLIVQYHPYGSLYDYLQRSDIDMEEMLLLAHSAAAGISHLHYEIKQGAGTHEKPSIAHRDIKSKNILVKASGECCIGDLGHAIKDTKEPDSGRLRTVGTRRYMAPELLSKTLNTSNFEAFRCADVYAFGLVLWEIARRARPYCEEYRVPFWEFVPADPSHEEMRAVVVDRKLRPAIPNSWTQEELMLKMKELICGCWAQNPSNRLNILRVKKNLHLRRSEQSEQMEKRVKLTGKIMDGSTTTNSVVTTSSNYTIS